jgi:hypothetical protein
LDLLVTRRVFDPITMEAALKRALGVWGLMLLVWSCGESVTPDHSVDGDPPEGLEPTDIPHVSWAELEQLILSGNAVMVAETHSNWAIVTLHDGRSVASREPERGAVFRLVERCGSRCAGMGIAIE